MGANAEPVQGGRVWSEAEFRAVLESAPDAMVITGADGEILLVNEQFVRLFGYDREELIGAEVEILLPADLREQHRSQRRDYFKNPHIRSMGENRSLFGLRRDGVRIPVEISLSPIQTDDGVMVASAIRDASGHKSTRDALQESEQRYRDMIETAHALVMSVDPEGRFLFVNEAWKKSLGYAAEEVASLRMFDIIHPDSRARCQQEFAALMRGESVRDSEAKWVCKDGSVLYVEGGASSRILDGKVVATQALFHDVSRRRQAEEAMSVRARQQRTIAELGTFALRTHKLHDVFDRAVALLRDTLNLELCMVFERLPGGDLLRLVSGVGWKAGQVGHATVDTRAATQAGYILRSLKPVVVPNLPAETRFVASPLLRDHGVTSGISVVIPGESGAFGVLGVYTTRTRTFSDAAVLFLQSIANVLADAVERERYEVQLAEANEQARQQTRLADIGAITAKIVHDLGNPLAGLMMQAQLIERAADRGECSEVVKESAQQVVATTRHLDQLMREFRSFTRDQKLDLAKLCPREFLRSVAEHWRPIAAERDIDVILRLPPQVPGLNADESLLRRVLDNLVKNALEAIDQGPGEVVLQIELPKPGQIQLSVCDTGAGLPDGVDVFRLFETTKSDGTGLGLPICRQLIRAHGGSMGCSPQAPRGTVFRIELPVAAS